MEETVEIAFDGLENKNPLRIKYARPVAEYTMDGELIKVYNTAEEASRYVPVSTGAIFSCCAGKVLSSKKANRIFLYTDDDISERLRKIAEEVPAINRPLITSVREYSIEGILIKLWPSILAVSETFNESFGRIKRHLKGSPEPIKDRLFLTGDEKITDRLAKYIKWKQEKAEKEKKDAERESLVKCAKEVLQISVYTSSGKFLRTCKSSGECVKIYGVSFNDVSNHILGRTLVTRGLMFLPYGEDLKERLKKVKNRKTWKNNL